MAREKNAMKNMNQSQLDGRSHSEIKKKEDSQLKDIEEHPSSFSSEIAKSKLPFYKLFSFADSLNIILMIFGTVGAVGNGLSVPLMTVILGNMINSFGENPDFHRLHQQVAKVCLDFVYLAMGTGMAAFLELTCWMVTGERQAARIRNLYLKAILRQEISFFDKETETGEVIEGNSGDNIMLREAISEKVGKFIQLMPTFLGAFAIAFVRAWDLTIVMIAIIPPLGVAAAVMAILVTKISSRQQEVYAKATVITEQTISSIRTVASFTGERKASDKYEKSLKSACSATVMEGVAVGIGTGVIVFFMFSGYSLGLWYGGKLILSKGYTGGKVVNAIFAVLLASLDLTLWLVNMELSYLEDKNKE